ncbi:MAG: DUF2723 domain-containing protein [Chloroflexi bacterium]|nr:DUF2723 domain-containing protein [Chloroflexota bacterium]
MRSSPQKGSALTALFATAGSNTWVGAWAALAALAALACFLSTLQWGINGSSSPYATDVGEIQNALPRWGTIHFTGYPQYTFLGSLWVTGLRFLGIEPAAGASLFSAGWGAVAAGLLVLAAHELGVPAWSAALWALIVSLSTSVWVDASVAEVHTMSMALAMASVWLALRYARSGRRADLLWLVAAFTQGVAHQRALVFLAPALGLLVYPRWQEIWRARRALLGIALWAPLTYLYLPLRQWMGADWTFGAPGTWRGFWAMLLDTKAERILDVPGSLGAWWGRLLVIARLLHEDLPLPLLGFSFAGFAPLLRQGRRREAAALAITAGLHLLLCLLIWEGRVSDALLAAKLPLLYLIGLLLALCTGALVRRWPQVRLLVASSLGLLALWLGLKHGPSVLAITRDASAEKVIAQVESITPPDAPTTFMALWGHDYWALTYAQAYRGQLRGLNLVDHNADFSAILARGDRLLTLSKTFYERPLDWWARQLGSAHLSIAAPDIVEIARAPVKAFGIPPGAVLDLGNGIEIASANLRAAADTLVLTVYWRVLAPPSRDYSIAVHLLAHDPPRGAEDILAQADRAHPVDGWYPTSRWSLGEIVRDVYTVPYAFDGRAVAVRVGMYRVENGEFRNSAWLVLPVETR